MTLWQFMTMGDSVTRSVSSYILIIFFLYFASNVMLKKLTIGVHKITGKYEPEVGRGIPHRIVALRQQELMGIIAFTENVDFVDWMDEDNIDIRILTFPEDVKDVKMAMYSINKHVRLHEGKI